MRLPLDAITLHPSTQARVELSQATVAEYAEVLKAGGALSDPVVFFDGSSYWLGDGHHTYHGARMAGLSELVVDLRQGTLRDAMLYAVGANAKHGLRRTAADKRKAVSLVLADPEGATWSDREVARVCNVSAPFVGQCRQSVAVNVGSESPKAAEKPEVAAKREAIEAKGGTARVVTTKHGTETVMDVSKIGKKAKPEPEPEPDPDLGDDPATLLVDAQRDVERLTAEVKALSADDAKAETLKWRQMADHAQREQSAAMERAAAALEREKWAMRQLQRCAKAVGEDDPTKVAAKVEGVARELAALKARFKVAA